MPHRPCGAESWQRDFTLTLKRIQNGNRRLVHLEQNERMSYTNAIDWRQAYIDDWIVTVRQQPTQLSRRQRVFPTLLKCYS